MENVAIVEFPYLRTPMNLQYLQDLYFQHPCLKSLTEEIVLPGSKLICLKNAQASSFSFLATSVFKQLDVNHVFILDDKETAAYFHNDFETLSGALDVCLFPDSYKKTGTIGELNSSHVMLRAEALMKFNGQEPHRKVLVTYPEAIVEKVVNTETFSKNTIYIKQSEKLNVEFLIEFLVSMSFIKVDFVYEPGQFAIRGGIIDIYSFGNENPYRIELFGEEVDSIRLFDPASQLSERKLLQVNIIPNVTTQFEDTEKIPLIDFMASNTLIWLKDWNVIQQRGIDQREALNDFLEHAHPSKIMDDGDAHIKHTQLDDFESVQNTEQALLHKTILEWGFQANLAKDLMVFNTQVQPSFNRQFQLLIANLQELEKKGYALFIFAEQAKQLERLHAIFTDLKTETPFTQIVKNIHEGFIDHDHKVVCYTDHQIFQRYHKYKVKQAYSKSKAITLRTLRDLQPGDYVTHIDHGVGVYSGLQKMEVNGLLQEAV